MERATGRPELNYRTKIQRLYVELRELSHPVILDYPTFAAAARECGASRIWAGLHWPVDNENGRELGLKVGENTWQRYQQFVLGFASPPMAALMTLKPPYWSYRSDAADHPARFDARSGLAISIGPGGSGTWQSIMLDAVPAGCYMLKLTVAGSGDMPARVQVAVLLGEGLRTQPVATATALVPADQTKTTVTVPWTSDGATPFRIAITATADRGKARVLVSAMGESRVWPMLGGSKRYYEPSLVGLAGQ